MLHLKREVNAPFEKGAWRQNTDGATGVSDLYGKQSNICADKQTNKKVVKLLELI